MSIYYSFDSFVFHKIVLNGKLSSQNGVRSRVRNNNFQFKKMDTFLEDASLSHLAPVLSEHKIDDVLNRSLFLVAIHFKYVITM